MTRINRRRESGFSLLEVLVAFSVLALTLGVLLRIFGGDGRLSGIAEEHSRAVVLAQSLLAGAGVESPLNPGQFSGAFDDRFSWSMSVTPFVLPDGLLPEKQALMPYWVELTVEWGEGDDLHEFTIGTLRLIAENRRP